MENAIVKNTEPYIEIYLVICNECKSMLTYTEKIDPDGDMVISIDPCKKCNQWAS